LRRSGGSLKSIAAEIAAAHRGGAGSSETIVPNSRPGFPPCAAAQPVIVDLVGLSSMATRRILSELAHNYEARTRTRVEIRSMGGVEAAKLVRAGEMTDIVVLASKVMNALESEGHLVRGSVKDFAGSEIGMAVRAGAPQPTIASEQAVKQAMLDAGRICYSTGPSGDHLKSLCERWGLADAVLSSALVAPPGAPVASFIANGEAGLGFQQLSELIGQPGVEVVGPLPPEIQLVTIFSAGVAMTSREPEAGRALVAYLASSETSDVKRRNGMAPA